MKKQSVDDIVQARWRDLSDWLGKDGRDGTYVVPDTGERRYRSWTDCLSLKRFMDAAANDARLKRLYPLMSHRHLWFSRTTRHPHVSAGPVVTVIGTDQFIVHSHHIADDEEVDPDAVFAWDRAAVGEGNLADTLDVVAGQIAESHRIAIDGDEDDLRRLEGLYVLTDDEHQLILSSFKGDASEILKLLQQGTDPNATYYDGATALTWAIRSKKVAAVKALLDAGADVTRASIGTDGVQEIHEALQAAIKRTSP